MGFLERRARRRTRGRALVGIIWTALLAVLFGALAVVTLHSGGSYIFFVPAGLFALVTVVNGLLVARWRT